MKGAIFSFGNEAAVAEAQQAGQNGIEGQKPDVGRMMDEDPDLEREMMAAFGIEPSPETEEKTVAESPPRRHVFPPRPSMAPPTPPPPPPPTDTEMMDIPAPINSAKTAERSSGNAAPITMGGLLLPGGNPVQMAPEPVVGVAPMLQGGLILPGGNPLQNEAPATPAKPTGMAAQMALPALSPTGNKGSGPGAPVTPMRPVPLSTVPGSGPIVAGGGKGKAPMDPEKLELMQKQAAALSRRMKKPASPFINKKGAPSTAHGTRTPGSADRDRALRVHGRLEEINAQDNMAKADAMDEDEDIDSESSPCPSKSWRSRIFPAPL